MTKEQADKIAKEIILSDIKLSKRRSFTIKDPTGTWTIQHDPTWDVKKEGDTYFCTPKEPEDDASNVTECAEFEEAWGNLKAPQNETVTSKWYFQKGFEASQASREIRLPEKKSITMWAEDDYSFEEGFNHCLDEIKRINEGSK